MQEVQDMGEKEGTKVHEGPKTAKIFLGFRKGGYNQSTTCGGILWREVPPRGANGSKRPHLTKKTALVHENLKQPVLN